MNALTQYKSSAGSGKTFTLVSEYLKIVIREPAEFRSVLAITFTNKATEEMKARIIGALSALAYLEGEELEKLDMFQMLKKYFTGKGLHFDISQRARTVLNLILSDYSNFSVSTIESFFQRVIRAFSKELNLPLGYEVDMKQDIVLERITQQTFREIGTHEKLTQVLRKLVERSMEEDKGWRIESKIKELGGEIFKEQFQEQLVTFNEEKVSIELEDVIGLEEELWKIRKKFENQMEEWADLAIRIIGQFDLTADDFKYKRSGAVGYFFNVTEKKDFEPKERAKKAAAGENEWYSAKSPLASTIQQAVDEGLHGILEQMVEYYNQQFTSYNSARIAAQNLYSFGVMNDLQSKLIDYRLENNRLVISDTNYLLREIVSEQDTPFIYEKVGTRYRYYLIDEFQDTSDMQWENLRPLVLEALSTGNGSLIVGDVKQSIYRWRNGNMELLLYKVEKEMLARKQGVTNKLLLDNYRTAHQVVAFNNHFFETAVELLLQEFGDNESRKAVIATAYEQIAQNPKKAMDGLVKVELLPNGKEDKWKESAKERCLESIREMIGEGFSPADICLLVRTNAEAVDISEHLQANGILVASAESLKLNNHPQVRFLHALLCLLNHEEEKMYRARVAYGYHLLHQLKQAAGQLSLGLESQVPDDLFVGKEGAALPRELRGRLSMLRQQPVYECMERLIRLFENILDHNAYVQAFLDHALEYGSKNEASISGFLAYWEEIREKPAIPASSSSQAVEVMTVHKAKGLEFPVVMLPFADWGMEPKANSLLWVRPDRAPYNRFSFLPVNYSSALKDSYFEQAYERETLLSYLDNLNLLYVAFTRPELRLYIFCPEDEKKENLKRSSSVIQQVLDAMPLAADAAAEGNIRMYGKAVPPKGHTKEAALPVLEGPKRSLAGWNQAVNIRYSSNRYLKSSMLERQEKIQMGELLHEALAHIVVPEDVPQAARSMVMKGFLPASLQGNFEEMLKEVISFEGIAPYFQSHWKVKAEAEIISASGKTLRPDRVNILDNKVVVIDYKTGHKKDVYLKQVNSYLDALEEMGYTERKGVIYYTSLGELEEV